jgi:DNA-directed RNA polymerase specialized sigma subunit
VQLRLEVESSRHQLFHLVTDLDQDTIAAEIGYSQMQVSRLLRRALANLRAQLLDS